MRSNRTCLLIGCVILFIQSSVLADHGREIRPKTWQWDATINDVFSLNNKQAWAVGDQGLILRTTDGGETWRTCQGVGLDLDEHRSLEQKLGNLRPISQTHELNPLTCSFKTVFFLNENRGWVAGSYHVPYLKTSRSVLLTTNDGGQSWHPFKGHLLPEISRIHFQDLLGGWAVGNSGNLYTSGIFATSTGGQIWSVQDVKPAKNWIDGELIPEGFVVIDDDGIIGRITGKRFEPSVVFGDRAARLSSVRMLDNKIGWAVGNGGAILQTTDAGQSWKRPQALQNQPFSSFDFTTVNICAGRVWVAGNPGTTVVSMDARTGSKLDMHLTSYHLPIQKLHFATRDKGWAVGGGGVILSTMDGGATWQTQRSSEDRTSILVVSQEVDHLPFGLLGFYSTERDYLSSVILLGQHSKMECGLAQAAVARLGCSTFVKMGHSQPTQDESPFRESDLYKLVRSIRSLRPNVVVCNRVPGVSDNELHALCRTAIELAGDPQSYPDQMDELALETWSVDRYLIRQKDEADINFKGSRYLPRTGRLLEDHIAISRGLVDQSARMFGNESYVVETFTGSVSSKRDDIFFGLKQLGRSIPKRRGEFRMGNLNSIATAPLKNIEFRKLLNMKYVTPDEVAELNLQIRSFATGIEARETGIWLMQLAEAFLDHGNLAAAAYSLEEMISRYRDHALTPAALMWLAQYYSSAEVMASIQVPAESTDDKELLEQLEDTELSFASSSPSTSETNGVKLVVWEVDESTNDGSSVATVGNSNDDLRHAMIKAVQEHRSRKASQYLSQLKNRDPDFAREAKVQFMEAMIVEKLPDDISNGNLLKSLKRNARRNSGYAFAANRELDARSDQPRLVSKFCYFTKVRPKLDGRLNDKIWQDAIANGLAQFKPVRPKDSKTMTHNDVVWLAYDDEFLFVAVRCNKIATLRYADTIFKRQRDVDLSSHDRMRIKLDFDRDLQSAFCFEVDQRGCAFDSCAGAKGWDPNWFIASAQDAKSWNLEIAIPWSELNIDDAMPRELAAVAMERLDTTATDVWSLESDRRPQRAASGIATGLSVAPHGFEMLKFVPPEPTGVSATN